MQSNLEVLVPGPFQLDQIDLRWHSPAAPARGLAANYIDRRWHIYQADAALRGAHLFDAPAACLRSGTTQNGRLQLDFEPTDYKTFFVTVLRDRDWFKTNAPNLITPVLGNSVLLTRGNEALLGVRSAKVSAYPGWAHLFGGVFDIVSSPGSSEPAANLQAHLYKELKEELELTEQHLASTPKVIGLYRDSTLNQPELVWQVELGFSLDELKRISNNDQEHDGFCIIKAGDKLDPIKRSRKSSPIQITPVAKAAIQWWSINR